VKGWGLWCIYEYDDGGYTRARGGAYLFLIAMEGGMSKTLGMRWGWIDVNVNVRCTIGPEWLWGCADSMEISQTNRKLELIEVISLSPHRPLAILLSTTQFPFDLVLISHSSLLPLILLSGRL